MAAVASVKRSLSLSSLLVCFLWLVLLSCGRKEGRQQSNLPSDHAKPVVRITQEPFYQQQKLNRTMAALETYIEQAVDVDLEYVPSINYDHSYYLLQSGKIDLLWAGSLGAFRVTAEASPTAPVQPLVIEKPNFVNVLLVHNRSAEQVETLLQQPEPLQALKDRRVLFGSANSGSSFLTPLLEMKDQGVALKDLQSCGHEPHHGHRAEYFGSSNEFDFVFMPGLVSDPLRRVSESAQSASEVVWLSQPKRNYSILGVASGPSASWPERLIRVQQALLQLNQQGHAEVLQQLGVAGFDMPDDETYLAQNRRVGEFRDELDGRVNCLDLGKSLY